MPFVDTTPEGAATGEVARMYEDLRASLGYVPHYGELFSHRPRVLAAWQALNGAIKENMDVRRYELATIAAARRLRSSYCMLAHGKVLLDGHLDGETLRRAVVDRASAGLAPVDVAVMDFAEKVVADATSIDEADVERLRAHGLSDAEVLDVALAAAARCFFSKTLDALGVEADEELAELDPDVRDALTVGRPIAGA
jgi:uncharacterized peroxidase-related enzyme